MTKREQNKKRRGIKHAGRERCAPRAFYAARVGAPVQETVGAEALEDVQPLASAYVPVSLLLYLRHMQ